MHHRRWFALTAALAAAAAAPAQVVFSDDFEDPARSTEWNILKRNALTAQPPDSTAVYGQSTILPIDGFAIPALNGQNSSALYLDVNRRADEGASIEAILAVPNATGDLGNAYEIEFDLYYNYSTGNTTMHALAGVGHDGVTAWVQNTGTAPGYFFGATADGTSGISDYRYWRGITLQPTGTGAQGTGTGLWDHNNAYYQSVFPNPPYPIQGAPGRVWTKVRAVRNGQYAAMFMNGKAILVASDATFTGGFPFVGMIDPATSFSPAGMFMLVDNVVVRKVDPASQVAGTVTFGDWGGENAFATSTPMIWRRAGETDAYTRFTVALGTDGAYTLAAPGAGTWDLHIPARRPYLSKTVSVTSDGTAQTVDITLISGDIDGDNSVTVFDYDKLSTYFDKSSADSDWGTADGDGVAPRNADLDGDGTVSVFDYDILSTNFDLVGDN